MIDWAPRIAEASAEHDKTQQLLVEAKQMLADMPADVRVDLATQALPTFTRLVGMYGEFCAFLRPLQVGADGHA